MVYLTMSFWEKKWLALKTSFRSMEDSFCLRSSGVQKGFQMTDSGMVQSLAMKPERLLSMKLNMFASFYAISVLSYNLNINIYIIYSVF